MILLSSAVRIYVAVEPVNMRRSFDGLMAQVRSVLAQVSLNGHVFAFINRIRCTSPVVTSRLKAPQACVHDT